MGKRLLATRTMTEPIADTTFEKVDSAYPAIKIELSPNKRPMLLDDVYVDGVVISWVCDSDTHKDAAVVYGMLLTDGGTGYQQIKAWPEPRVGEIMKWVADNLV